MKLISLMLVLATLSTGCLPITVNRTKGQSSICRVHHVAMKKERVDLVGIAAHIERDQAYPFAGDTEYGCIWWLEDRSVFQNQTVYFESGRSALNAEAGRKLAEVAKYLNAHPSTIVIVEGHCDDRGTRGHNRRLGERRALAVRKELIRAGVDPTRVDTMSYGKDRPVDPGHNPETRKRNRRAEFVLSTPPK